MKKTYLIIFLALQMLLLSAQQWTPNSGKLWTDADVGIGISSPSENLSIIGTGGNEDIFLGIGPVNNRKWIFHLRHFDDNSPYGHYPLIIKREIGEYIGDFVIQGDKDFIVKKNGSVSIGNSLSVIGQGGTDDMYFNFGPVSNRKWIFHARHYAENESYGVYPLIIKRDFDFSGDFVVQGDRDFIIHRTGDVRMGKSLSVIGQGGTDDMYFNFGPVSNRKWIFHARHYAENESYGVYPLIIKRDFDFSGDFVIQGDGDFIVHRTGDVKVNGKLEACEVQVKVLSGCDFVFDSDYKLMPINDLDNFVKTERHLPEIESAVDMETNGVNLSDLNMKLLKKVEELTLYTIEQQKELEKLKEIIERNGLE